MVEVKGYGQADLQAMVDVWNEVVRDGIAFPQEDELDLESGAEFFGSQTHCGVAVEDGRVLGLYILHPNNVGRCGHIANASYAVSSEARGKGIGRALVEDPWRREGRRASACFSSTPWSPPTPAPATSTRSSASPSWGPSRADSACLTAPTPTSAPTITSSRP